MPLVLKVTFGATMADSPSTEVDGVMTCRSTGFALDVEKSIASDRWWSVVFALIHIVSKCASGGWRSPFFPHNKLSESSENPSELKSTECPSPIILEYASFSVQSLMNSRELWFAGAPVSN